MSPCRLSAYVLKSWMFLSTPPLSFWRTRMRIPLIATIVKEVSRSIACASVCFLTVISTMSRTRSPALEISKKAVVPKANVRTTRVPTPRDNFLSIAMDDTFRLRFLPLGPSYRDPCKGILIPSQHGTCGIPVRHAGIEQQLNTHTPYRAFRDKALG